MQKYTNDSKDLEMEDIKKGKYKVYRDGRVYDKERGRFCTISHNGFGYLVVNLYCNRRSRSVRHYLHRVVAEHFIENPLGKPCVNHKDCDKSNNAASNLEWVTHKENTRHGVKMGRVNSDSRVGVPTKHLGTDCIEQAIRLLCSGESLQTIANRLGTARGTVTTWLNGRSRSEEVLKAIDDNSCGACRCVKYKEVILSRVK